MTDRWVETDGRRLRARLTGAGLPVVVLDMGGGASGLGSWPGVEEQLAEHATVLTYDRAGLGASDPPAQPPTAEDMAADLQAVLTSCAPGRPVVLVGFSLAGLVAQVLAARHPALVGALVLVDPTAEDAYADRRPGTPDPAAVLTRVLGMMTRLPPARALVRRYAAAQLGPDADPALTARLQDELCSPRFWAGVRLETARLRESCAQAAAAVRDPGLPDVPVVVLTAGRRAGRALRTRTAHERLAASARQGQLVVVDGAPHNIVATRPDAVVAAVLALLPELASG